jgi:serine phosphatase RsbU (regulator of sigma subunit)/hemoglobin-like flavoprotein
MVLDIEEVEQSFAEISPRLDELTMVFYTDLFSTHPELRPLFQNVDLVRQRRKLAAMLTLIVTNLRRMDVLVPALRSLGARHRAYGATDESYTWTEESLLRSLERTAGECWDERTQRAWAGAIGLVTEELRVGHAAGEATGDQHDDLDLLMEIASNPALAFQRNSLFAGYVEKKKIDHEMDLARTVQQNLIRRDFPSIQGYSFSMQYEPATQVGGDYFDWFKADDDHICFVLGDVAGKGVPGALVMCRLSGAARAVLATEQDVARAVSALNAHMCDGMVGGRFITLACLQLDLRTHRYTLANAGHHPPLVRRSSTDAAYVGHDQAGMPIGIDRSAVYESVEQSLEPGDSLILFTDGINEAIGPGGELYGMERIQACALATEDPGRIGAELLEDVRRFGGGRPQSDDLTILTIARQA